jgi:phosphoglycolate phosphatase
MTANTVLFPETSSVLNTLKARGAKIGIVSTKYRYRIMEFVEKEFPKDSLILL